MSPTAAAQARLGECPLRASELRPLLEQGLSLGAETVSLLDGRGAAALTLGAPPSREQLAWDAPVVVRGRTVATLRLRAPAGQAAAGALLEPLVGLLAGHVASNWLLSSEVDSLAGEVVRAYAEIHVIHGLGELLTTELSVAGAADHILKLLVPSLEASWATITLEGATGPTTMGRHVPEQPWEDAEREQARADGRLLERTLRSAGRLMGSIAVARGADRDTPFSSVDAKLLDAVAALAGNALRNSQLYEELRLKTEALGDREAHLQAALNEVAHQALHDGLTSLPNRTLLHDRLELGVRQARRSGEPLALLVMDLDRFKDVNDTYGHHTGDLLLKLAGRRLRAALRETDTVARLGGDEFALLLPQTDVEGATRIARRLLKAIEKPYTVDGRLLSVGASIGIAMCPEQAADAISLLQCGDVAMYVAKRSGVGVSVYTSQQDEYRNGRLALLSELRAAIENGELRLQFQPKVTCGDGAVRCAEALVRWQHPERGLIPPDQFIPLAEETGIIRRLSRWVLREAVRRCRAWQDAGLEIGVAVNLSMRDLHDAELPALIGDLLREEGLAARLLIVEVTESVLMADPQRALEVVQRLCAMGVRISIDDFGMGYSSLAYLRRLPVHEIKIDREFVRHMVDDRSDAAIVRSTIGLGHDLGLSVVAEGVEDLATSGLLAQLGCDAAQGYFLGKPMEADVFVTWAHQQVATAAGRAAVAEPTVLAEPATIASLAAVAA